ncbi:MAG: amidohydrolase family protein [Pseudomonadales bacterium]|nr:amidohydrolase family protein [Pseudomonadales bacterium]
MTYAIDIHIHADADSCACHGSAAHFRDAAYKYFGAEPKEEKIAQTAAMYRDLDMMAILLAVDSSSGMGTPPVTNDFVAQAVKNDPDVFIGFASVDPWAGKKAIDEAKRAMEELGLKGFKFHPATQDFYMNDKRFYPLYETIGNYGVPMLIHTGTTGIGAGLPGGGGLKLGGCRPIPYMDDVAADFPEINMILAHPSWPWQDESLAMAVHKPNVYIDLSGWSPRYFSPTLIQYCNRMIPDKVLFGSDYPLISPEKWLEAFAQAPFRDEVRPKILFENANRLLGLNLTRSEPKTDRVTSEKIA